MVIPKENVIEIKDGKKVVSEKRSFPGYILVKMEMNDKNWYFVRNTPKVTGFVGAGKKPKPLIRKRSGYHPEAYRDHPGNTQTQIPFRSWRGVKIIDGPFMNFNGVVDAVNEEKNLLKVTVTIFGRRHAGRSEFLQVEKI